MIFDEELEEFRIWRAQRLQQTPIDKAFEALERILDNPYCRSTDSAFRVLGRALVLLKEEIDRK